jgi:hypothetical protein
MANSAEIVVAPGAIHDEAANSGAQTRRSQAVPDAWGRQGWTTATRAKLSVAKLNAASP